MDITKLKANPLYFSSKLLNEGAQTHTIESVEIRKIDSKDRVVLLLKGQERDLRLTPLQVATLSRTLGNETDEWKGKAVTLSKSEGQGINVETVTKPEAHK